MPPTFSSSSGTSPEPTLKLLLIGPSSSGKTSLLLSYTTNTFSPDTSTSTIGVDFKIKKLSIPNNTNTNNTNNSNTTTTATTTSSSNNSTRTIRLLLFDTAGQERFRTLTSSYYRNAQGVLLVYDVCNRESFLDMPRWFAEVESFAGSKVVKCLVGSKIDKADCRVVTSEEGRELAERFGAGYVEVSSKTGENVRRAFVELVEKIVERASSGGNSGDDGGGDGGAAAKTVNVVGGGVDQGWGCMC